jgi:hypothetical protein
MFDEGTIERLADHLRATAHQIEKEQKDKPPAPVVPTHTDDLSEPVDHVHVMKKLSRQLDVIGYNPLMLEEILEEYDIHCGSLEEPLEEMPLHINDEDIVSVTIAKWRLENNV